MDLNRVLTALQLEESAGVLETEWAASQSSLPADGPRFLDPDYVAGACRDVGLPPEPTAAAIAAAGRIAAHPPLCALAWHFHHCLFASPTSQRQNLGRWPSLTSALQADAGLFYVVVLLSGLAALQAVHRARGIPAPIVRDTLADVALWVDEYWKQYGCWGLSGSNLNWLMNHVRGELYRLGRLQFIPGPFWGKLRAFRHQAAGTVVALSEDGVQYRADGQVDGAGGVVDAAGAWTARLVQTASEVIGNPIAPAGYAVKREVRLPSAEWKPVLAPGDPTLHIHVPTGSPMDFDLCGESLHAALEFFPRHFPEKPFVAFCCGSWFLDAQFEALLPPTSNIVRFLREVYLFPIRSNGQSALERVFGFGRVPSDLRQAPRDTTLRRALIDHLLSGGHLRGGGCFLFPEDLAWGRQVYRQQALPWSP